MSVLVVIPTSVLGRTYFCTEVFEREALNSVYAQLRIWLHYREPSRYYSKPNSNQLHPVKFRLQVIGRTAPMQSHVGELRAH